MTGLLESPEIEAIASEDSVRGVLVRIAIEQAAGAASEELSLLEEALQLLLTRFQAGGGELS